jgi:hypothetical protein
VEAEVSAYKFLATGAIGPLSRFAWPGPGVWVEASGPLIPCKVGVHVCRPYELAHWIHDELWELEIGDDDVAGIDCLVVRRARLAHRIDAWSDGGHQRFATACVERARELARGQLPELVADALAGAEAGFPAVAAYTAALVVARLAPDPEAAYARERAWQGAWIASEVIRL